MLRVAYWTAAAVLCLAGPAWATVVRPVKLSQMTAEAEVIVHGRVGAQEVTREPETGRILTFTFIEVIEAVKGAKAGDLLTLYQVGGALHGVTAVIPGASRFAPGEEIVLFAMRFRGRVVTYGIGLGKYVVHERNGMKTVAPEYGDVSFATPSSQGLAPAAPPDALERPLKDFLIMLRAQWGGAR